jgi:preprotein translocase subunit YajC
MNQLFSDLSVLMAPTQTDAAAGPQSFLPTIIMFGLVFLIFYFLIIRPQNKKQKETKAMLSSLAKGDKVQSIGGIQGTIQSIKEDAVVVKIDTNTKMTFSRSAIASVLEKGKTSKRAEKKVEEVTESDDAEDVSEDENED